MTTRNGRSVWQVCKVVGLWCLLILTAPFAAFGDGGIAFNGGSTGTSKIQNENGNVLNNANTMTICAWVYPIGQGESSAGMVLGLDKVGNGIRIHRDASSTLAFFAKWSLGDGKWTVPVSSNVWSAVACTYDSDDDYNDPAARVNFSSATVTQVGANPSGSAISPTSGYCVGNLSGDANTWDGRIAHVQVFNRILSAAEMDACLQAPGSITRGLRLWLPMMNGIDVHDRSGNGFHGIGTDLDSVASGPLPNQLGAPPRGVALIDTGITNVNRYIIPRYGDGTNHPAGVLHGVGPASAIQGIVYGPSDGSNAQPIVSSEDYAATVNGVGVNQWDFYGSPPSGLEAVLQPVVRNLSILGKVDLPGYQDTQGGPTDKVNTQVGQYNPSASFKDLEHGLFVKGAAAQIEGVNFFHIAGTCCRVQIGANLDNLSGPILPFDRQKPRLYNCSAIRAYRGFEIDAIDCILGSITGQSLRDYGIKFVAGSAQVDRGTSGLHFWGISSSPSTSGASPSPAVWFDTGAGACWGGPWYAESSDIGMKIQSNENRLGPVFSHTCPYGNITISGANNILHDFQLTMVNGQTEVNGAPAILIGEQKNEVRDGYITMPASNSNPGEVAIRITNGTNQTIQNVRILGSAASGAMGTAIQPQSTLNRCVIIAHIQWLASGIGVDLNYGGSTKLGTSNYIWITTEEAMSSAINFPTGWNNVTPKNTSNKIYINGRQWYPPSDEF